MRCLNKHISDQQSAAGCAETPLCCTEISLSSAQAITRRMSEAVEGLVRAMPPDMEQEKATLVLAMVLTKKIVNTVPSLLPRVFRTTVNYINQHLHNYIVRMVSTVQQLGASHG